jgi:hypothetical protein
MHSEREVRNSRLRRPAVTLFWSKYTGMYSERRMT